MWLSKLVTIVYIVIGLVILTSLNLIICIQERKFFDEKFIRLDTKKLCELTSAADSLQLRPLVDLTSRALARMIEGKTPEEIRETFHLPDDLTEVFVAESGQSLKTFLTYFFLLMKCYILGRKVRAIEKHD